MSVGFDLPEPPSVNGLFNSRHRKTKGYRAWIKEAGWALLRQRAGRHSVSGKYTVLLQLFQGSRKDGDNCMKAVLDLLVSHRITDDDRHCKRSTAEKTGNAVGRCLVYVTPWEGAA